MAETLDRTTAEVNRRWFPHHCKKTARLNHGSFGSVPTPVHDAQQAYQANWRRQPDQVYFFDQQKQLERSRAEIARLINCDVAEVALMDNVTFAAEVVMQHVMRRAVERKFAGEQAAHEQEYVLCNNWIYPGIRNVIRANLALVDIKPLIVQIPFPLPAESKEADDLILRQYEEALTTVPQGSIRLAVFDHISSVPGAPTASLSLHSLSSPCTLVHCSAISLP
mmetsp:Transcript_1589/g.5606  ORF Transcript_1589/g.5606 Transcript_1589/m.5606 type:complete len:223 (-) Transcript_1589:943-1611(-)